MVESSKKIDKEIQATKKKLTLAKAKKELREVKSRATVKVKDLIGDVRHKFRELAAEDIIKLGVYGGVAAVGWKAAQGLGAVAGVTSLYLLDGKGNPVEVNLPSMAVLAALGLDAGGVIELTAGEGIIGETWRRLLDPAVWEEWFARERPPWEEPWVDRSRPPWESW